MDRPGRPPWSAAARRRFYARSNATKQSVFPAPRRPPNSTGHQVAQGEMIQLRNLVLHFILLLSLPPIVLAQQSVPPPPLPAQVPIRVNVNEVNISVAVTDSHGKFVPGLHRGDFRVFDNGIEQPLTGFLSNDDPSQVVLLLEAGPAALLNNKAEVHAAQLLIRSLVPADRIAVVTYDRGPSLILDFTNAKSEAHDAIARMNFFVGFGELNLASSVASVLDWLAILPGKKTIVLLSSGVDTSSDSTWQLTYQKIKTSDVRILAASVSADIRKTAKKQKLSTQDRQDRDYLKAAFKSADDSLRLLCEATGGRVYFPKSDRDWDRDFLQIAQSFQGEYSLAIAPTAPTGQVHSLQVKVNHHRYHVLARTAYLAPALPAN
jgi:VWFA-related protein